MKQTEINDLSRERMRLSVLKRQKEKEARPYEDMIKEIDRQLWPHIQSLYEKGERDFDKFWALTWRTPSQVDEDALRNAVSDEEWDEYRKLKSAMNQYIMRFPKLGRPYLIPRRDAPKV